MEIVSSKNISLSDIFSSPAWDSFCDQNKNRIRPDVLENVEKILLCRTGKLGFTSYKCECGYSSKVPFTCKSRFCSTCGKIACDNWMNRVISWSLPNMQYHHVVFTIPEQLRNFLILHRKDGLDSLFKASTKALIQVFQEKYHCKPGIISIVHTFGGDIKWNPHVHSIVTCGGLSSNKQSWIWTKFLPFNLLRQSWKYHLVSALRLWAKSVFSDSKYKTFNTFLDSLYKKDWYINVGKKLDSLEFTIRYIGRYAKRPVLAETRIIDFDGENVSFSFRDKQTKKESVLSFPVFEFIGKLIRHIPIKNHRMIRYSGIFANRVKATLLLLVQNLLSANKQKLVYLKQNVLSWRDRIKLFTNIDPLQCPNCSRIMYLASISIRLRDGSLKCINFSP